MKIYKTRCQFILWLAICLPLNSYAAMDVPYWLSLEWIAAKISNFNVRNTERTEPAQKQESPRNPDNLNTANAHVNQVQPVPELAPRKPKLAPVEFATPKVNEKLLSKEELNELRMQLKQNP